MSKKYNSIDDFVEATQKKKQKKSGSNKNSDQKGNQKASKKKASGKNTFGKIILILQTILSLLFVGLILYLNILPGKYLYPIIGAVALLWLVTLITQLTRKGRIPGKIIGILMIIILSVGSWYVFRTNIMIGNITDDGPETEKIVVAVMKNDPAEDIKDAKNYDFAYQQAFNKESTSACIDAIQDEVGKKIKLVGKDSAANLINAMISGEAQAVIYSESMTASLNELYDGLKKGGSNESFSDQLKIIYTFEIEKKKDNTGTQPSVDDITENCFSLYISGSDEFGQLNSVGRSDVNIIMFFNPETKQVLLVNTPRDYYIKLPDVSGDTKDKLTHAGIYGVEESIKTLEALYKVDIDYNIKINFDSLINMVDALGGVEVYSEEDFTSNAGLHFKKGYNYVDGNTALHFARERKHLKGGDLSRGKNQMALITAMIKKAMSPSILTSYSSIMSSLEDSFATNMDERDIKALVRMQLDDGAEWNIVSVGAIGTGGDEYCYSLGGKASVVIPDEKSVELAQYMIKELLNGSTLKSAEEYSSILFGNNDAVETEAFN